MMRDGFLERHVATIRVRYKAKRDAMLAALQTEFGGDGRASPDAMQWNTPGGGMFIWARLPAGVNAKTLLPLALEKGVAFVPGEAFYVQGGDERVHTLVTLGTLADSAGDAAEARSGFPS